MADVTVVIPTLRRPDSLERALRSLFQQQGVADRLREIVVADNDPEGSASPVVTRLAEQAPFSLIYAHARVPGVATARNVGLATTDAPLIAFLDDDEVASPDWLATLLAAREALGADVVFGPIRGRAPDAAPAVRPYLEWFFGREGPDHDQLLDEAFGCGNSLMVRQTALPGPTPFDTSADQTGGEDDALFAALAARGGTFGWASRAWVEEYAPAHRATLRYALSRAFAFGQSPSQLAAHRKAWPEVLKWMVVGAGQTAVYGLAAAVSAIARPSRAPRLWDRAARGLGKLLWMPGLEPRFYGSAELKRLQG